MKMIFVLIILAVILLCAAVIVFFWAVRQRQFDDLDVHAYNILKEDTYLQDDNYLKEDSHLKDEIRPDATIDLETNKTLKNENQNGTIS